MDCKQVTDLLATYLDNEASGKERLEIESHLADCKSCQRELDSLRIAQQALRMAFKSKAGDAEPPSQAWEQLQPGLEIYRPSLLFLFRKRRWRIVATIILLVLMAAGLLWAFGIWQPYP